MDRNVKIKLCSNFVDTYDHYMDVTDCDTTFNRRTDGGPNRIEMLTMLESMGFDVPACGIIRRIYEGSIQGLDGVDQVQKDKYLKDMEFVVYTDLNSHCGEGKVKLGLGEAFEKYPDCFATQYLRNSHDGSGDSIRLLVIGDKQFWMEYKSKDDWRSNVGDVDIKEIKITDRPILNHIKIPLYAIDFVRPNGYGKIFAVDFNVAPGIKDTPAEEAFKPQEIANLIKQKISELMSGWQMRLLIFLAGMYTGYIIDRTIDGNWTGVSSSVVGLIIVLVIMYVKIKRALK